MLRSDYDSISRILTLRYDPLKKPVRRPLAPADFVPRSDTSAVESKIIDLVRQDCIQKYGKRKFKRISLSLSGGVDSRLTLAMITSFIPDVKVECVSVGFGEENDEVAQAEEMARHYDCNFHKLVLDDIVTELPKLIGIVKEPRWNLYQYYPFEYGKKYSDVFYTGDGGDELFGGYTFRYHKYLSLLGENAGWKEKAKLYLACHERDWVPDQAKMFGPLIKFSWDRMYRLLQPYFDDNGLHPLDQVFLADYNGKLLYDWLPVNVAFSKHLELSINSLFLTDAMIMFATHLPWQAKYDPQKQVGKMPLRSILNRQKGVSNKSDAAKRGFSVGLGYIWNKNAREIALAYLHKDSDVIKSKIISPQWLKAAMKSLEGSTELNPRYVNKALSLLALEVWHRIFVTRSMKRSQKL